MAKYRLETETSKLFISGRKVKFGEEFELSSRQAEAFKNVIVMVKNKRKPASKSKSKSK